MLRSRVALVREVTLHNFGPRGADLGFPVEHAGELIPTGRRSRRHPLADWPHMRNNITIIWPTYRANAR